jgi:hypothetical protein
MSKILVVEPYKILQRAIALSFFPDHLVEVTGEIPDRSAIEQRSYDVAIIDAGALRERNTAGDLNRRLQDWQIPMIWLEDNMSTVAPVRDNLMVLRKPIARNDLLTALSCCQAKGSTIPPTYVGEKLRNREVLAASELKPDPEHTAEIIELVDVVEEKITDRERDEPLERKK